jgi:hypothetical protein
MNTPLSEMGIKDYYGGNIKMSGISNPTDLSTYLESGIDKSGLPTTIPF